MDRLTKFNQARITTDAFCAYYKPIKAHYFPAVHFDWLIFKYGSEVAAMKYLQIFSHQHTTYTQAMSAEPYRTDFRNRTIELNRT